MTESQDLKNEVKDNTPAGQDIIHTLRTAQQHQVTLSLIADQKANIIIGFA